MIESNSPPDLHALYQEFNQQFFSGRLPDFRVRVSLAVNGDGVCYAKRRIIFMRPATNPDETRTILLHEMCHIETLGEENSHGPAFQAQLMNLYHQGEQWALEEVEAYQKVETWDVLGELEDQMQEIAMEGDRPPFNKLLRILLKSYGLSPSLKEHQRRRLKRAWRRACLDAEREKRLLDTYRAELERRGVKVHGMATVPTTRRAG